MKKIILISALATLLFSCQKKKVTLPAPSTPTVTKIDSVDVVLSTENPQTESKDWYFTMIENGDTVLFQTAPKKVRYSATLPDGTNPNFARVKLPYDQQFLVSVYDIQLKSYKPFFPIVLKKSDILPTGVISLRLNY